MIASQFLKKACKKYYYSNYKSLGFQTNQTKLVAHTPVAFVETGSITSQVTADDATYIYIASGAEDGAKQFYLHCSYTNPVTAVLEHIYKLIPAQNLAVNFPTEVAIFDIADNPVDFAIVDAFEGDAPPMPGYVIEFFRPFILTSLGISQDIGSPYAYTDGLLSLQSAANNSQYSDLFITMFIAMMLANRDYDGEDFSSFTVCKYLQGKTKWANYFDNWLNETLKPENYNSFLWMESQVKQFWDSENASADTPTLYARFRDFVKNLFEGTDRALWGAPGKYYFNLASEEGLAAGAYTITDEVIPPAAVLAAYADPAVDPISTVISVQYPSVGFFVLNNTAVARFDIAKNSAPFTPYYPETIHTTPDFDANPGKPNKAIFDWVMALMQTLTGDAPIAYSTTPATMGAGYGGVYDAPSDTYKFALGTAYNLGLLAAGGANGKFIAYNFTQNVPVANAPWFADLDAALTEFGDEVTFMSLEQKSIE